MNFPYYAYFSRPCFYSSSSLSKSFLCNSLLYATTAFSFLVLEISCSGLVKICSGLISKVVYAFIIQRPQLTPGFEHLHPLWL